MDTTAINKTSDAKNGVVYNVTTKVDTSIADAWLKWMLKEHAPQMIATHCFTHFTALQLAEVEDEEDPTFTFQYFSNSMEHYQRYLEEFADDLRDEAQAKWGNRFMAFRTLMKLVN